MRFNWPPLIISQLLSSAMKTRLAVGYTAKLTPSPTKMIQLMNHDSLRFRFNSFAIIGFINLYGAKASSQANQPNTGKGSVRFDFTKLNKALQGVNS